MITMRPPGEFIDGLIEFCKCFPPEWSIVEVGTYSGEATTHFADHFKQVFCIDTWEPIGEISTSMDNYNYQLDEAEQAFNLLRAKKKNIIKLKGREEDLCDAFSDNSLDIVYLDADHRRDPLREEVVRWMTKVKPGGVLAGHDYHATTPDVILVVNEFFRQPIAVFPDHSWYVRRI